MLSMDLEWQLNSEEDYGVARHEKATFYRVQPLGFQGIQITIQYTA